MTRISYRIIWVVVLMGGSAFGQVIRVQKETAVDLHQDVRLGDVAKVSGIDAKTAESLSNLVILPDIRESRTLRAEAVLTSVVAQIGPGSVADHLQISGSATCELKLETQNSKLKSSVAVAETPAGKSETQMPNREPATGGSPATTAPAPAKETQNPTLAKQLITEVEQNMGVKAEDLRVSFTTASPLLEQPTPVGKKWVFRSFTRSYLGSVQIEAQLVDDVRVVQKLNVQMQVLERAAILAAAAPLSRGDVVTKSHFRVEEVWLDRQMPTLLQNEKDVIGMEALRPITVGTLLDQRDFKPVEMASRGEALSVVFIHGNLKVQMKGLAMQGGKLHDTIPVKNDTTNEVYQATLIGKGLAVVGGPLNEVQEKQLRETR